MACKNICRLCDKLILSQTVTFAYGRLNINIPAGSYMNGEKYCIVIAQAIPAATTITAPVVITIGDGTTAYNLVTKDGTTVVAAQVRTRTKYSTIVDTSATAGVFRLLGDLCKSSYSTLPALTPET